MKRNFFLEILLIFLWTVPFLSFAREVSNSIQGRDPSQEYIARRDERLQLRLRAEQGDIDSQILLADWCERGEGGDRNIHEAFLWYHKAAEQGSPAAQTALGRMLSKGIGTEKDLVSAAAWYRRAALQGYPRAQGLLGLACMKGEGVDVDNVSALMWFTLGSVGDESLDVYWSRKFILARMSKEQVAEAKRKALEFVPQRESLQKTSSTTPSKVDTEPVQPLL